MRSQLILVLALAGVATLAMYETYDAVQQRAPLQQQQVQPLPVWNCPCGPLCRCRHLTPENRQSHEQPITERVINLPEDGRTWHLSLFLHDDYARRADEVQLLTWFQQDRRLKSLADQTRWHVYTASDPHYRNVFAATIPTLPAVVLQRADGFYVFKATGPNIGNDPVRLGNLISDCCPRPTPSPQPINPQPGPFTPGPPILPDTIPVTPDEPLPFDEPQPPAQNPEANYLLYVLSLLLGGGAAGLHDFKAKSTL